VLAKRLRPRLASQRDLPIKDLHQIHSLESFPDLLCIVVSASAHHEVHLEAAARSTRRWGSPSVAAFCSAGSMFSLIWSTSSCGAAPVVKLLRESQRELKGASTADSTASEHASFIVADLLQLGNRLARLSLLLLLLPRLVASSATFGPTRASRTTLPMSTFLIVILLV
jgi:hypothetical protein